MTDQPQEPEYLDVEEGEAELETVSAPPVMSEDIQASIARLNKAYKDIREQMSQVIVGQSDVVDQILIAIASVLFIKFSLAWMHDARHKALVMYTHG
mgnify:CR=1 FL=1